MANISKFKDKKTGEVYDLGPKTWEITLTEEQEYNIGDRDEMVVLGNDNLDANDFISNVKPGDFVLMPCGGELSTFPQKFMLTTVVALQGMVLCISEIFHPWLMDGPKYVTITNQSGELTIALADAE